MKTYTHESFVNDYANYFQKTGNKINDITLEKRETFVTWCRKCGKGVTRQNIKYSLFRDQRMTDPLCFNCQQNKATNEKMTTKQKLLLIMLIEKKFTDEEQRNHYYKILINLTKRQASDLIRKLGYKTKISCHNVSCME